MLISPRSVERDNQNALRKFPFADAAECGNRACVLPNGAIIDAQLYIPGTSGSKVWLSRIQEDGILVFSTETGEVARTEASITPATAIPVIFTGNGGPLPGGVIVFGSKGAVTSLQHLYGQTFTAAQTELAAAAVTWLELQGVRGFRLDDGNIVSGDVKFRGENGCDVATYRRDGINYLRISAIGGVVETEETGGFISKIVATSDNTNFTVSNDATGRVINILPTGVTSLQDDNLNANQDTVCAHVRKIRGTVPSASASIPLTCEDDLCAVDIEGGALTTYTITFMSDATTQYGNPILVLSGSTLGTVYPPPAPNTEVRFAGYYDAPEDSSAYKTLYYNYAGIGVGKFTANRDVTLYAHWMPATSYAEVDFTDYGTLHLAAPNFPNYVNPIQISGCENPIPTVREIPNDVLETGGTEALSELILHPTVPSGEVYITMRGINKAYST